MLNIHNENEQDAKVSTPTQQDQVSIQAQEVLLSASPTAQPQHEQNTAVLQPNSKQNPRKLINSLLLITIVIVFIITVTTAWILNIAGIIKGPWESIFTALSTSLSVLLAIIQIYLQAREERTLAIQITIDPNKATTID